MDRTMIGDIMTVLFFAGALTMWLIVFHFFRRTRLKYLREWLFSWTFLLASYVMLLLTLWREIAVFGYLFSIGIIIAGFYFLKGMYAYRQIRFARLWYVILGLYIMTVLFHPVVLYPLLLFQQLVYLFSAFFYMVAGLIILRREYKEEKIYGVISILFAFQLAFYPIIIATEAFYPFGLLVSALLGGLLSIGMIFLHYFDTVFVAEKERKRLYYIGFHDRLTKLRNRAYFEDYVMPTYKDTGIPVSIFFVDLNNLKHINDTRGHSYGDKLLVKTARLLKSIALEDDVVIRYGGDEFLVVRPHASKEKNKAFLDALAKKSSIGNYDNLSIAAGVAERTGSHSVDELLEEAERKMYKRKDKMSSQESD